MKSARSYIEAAHSVYIACHVLPDGDAIGSLLALGLALRKVGKACTLACADPLPAKYDFLPDAREIVSRPPGGEDLLVTVDVSDVERLGSLYHEAVFHSRPVLNIDHHVTNTRFGTLNLIRPLPSTAEIVYALLRGLHIALDADIATALLTGLVTDTRCFRTGNVTTRQLRTSIVWMKAGASLPQVNALVYDREPFAMICLWGQALAGVQRRAGIVWAEIDRDMLSRCSASPMEADGLVSFLASAQGMDAAVVFRVKQNGRIEVSMRAAPAWDLSGVALSLGGGGHPRAAGCIVDGPMAVARERVLQAIEAALRDQAQRCGDRKLETVNR